MHICCALLILLTLPSSAAACIAGDGGASCFHGGVCGSSGVCECRVEWTGPLCAQLALEPARTGVAYAQPLTSSWGGSVARVGDAHFMVVAEMEDHCGLDSWEANSALRLSRSETGAEGPFLPLQLLLPPFAHNPTLHATANGSLVVAHIGEGVPYHPRVNCTNGTTPWAMPAHVAAQPPQLGTPGTILPPPNFLFLPGGDPGAADAEWLALPSSGGSWAANNPALLIHADDSALLVYKVHCACPGGCFCAQFGVAVAPHWSGPYTDTGLIDVYGEDAYVWKDPAGVPGGGYHMLFQGGSYAPIYPSYSGHFHTAASADGLSWIVDASAVVFNASIPLVDGSVLQLTRRERHQVLFDARGAPSHLFNGVMAPQGAGGDASFTAVQPIAGAAAR